MSVAAIRGRWEPRSWIGALPILTLLAVWQAAATAGVASPALLPSPPAVFRRLAESFVDPSYLGHVVVTLYRLFAGFSIAFVLGVSLGLAGASSPAFGAALRPLVRVLAPVPKIAIYPALILSLGFDDAPKIILVAADALFPILLATYGGAVAVEPKLVWSALAAGTTKAGAIWKVLLPATLPSILTGSRIGLVVSCIVVFLAEMITSTNGLGYVLIRAARSFQTVEMFVPLITISLIGLALNGLLALARRKLLVGFPEEG
jgi:NitT/TauT family transport system permease protein